MKDVEMLELAAKAIGLQGYVEGTTIGGGACLVNRSDIIAWRPLQDDGDALRLAVKLGIRCESDILTLYFGGTQSEFFFNHGHAVEKSFMVDHSGDPYTATRRAIVRAAAEIGKAMP